MTRAGAALLIVAASAGLAHAQQEDVRQKPALSVERFAPPPGQAAYLGADDPDTLPAGAWGFGAALSLASRPIVLRELGGDAIVTTPVAWRLGLDLGVARGLGSRWQLGLAVPVLLQGGDRLRGIGLSEKPLDRAAFGDARLSGKARLAGEPGARGIAATASIVVVLPTGDDGDFAGEAGTVIEWRIAGGWRAARWAIAANAGARFRTEEVVLISPARASGDELVAALAGEVALPFAGSIVGGADRAWAIGELDAVLGDAIGPPGAGGPMDPMTRGGASTSRGPSPVEARIGARVQVAPGLSLSIGVGAGLTPAEIGAPAWRAIASMSWSGAPRGDWDGDGIPDADDRCVAEREDFDGWSDTDGCPDPDNDGDGLLDADDQCPDDMEDPDGWQDLDGCPDDEEHLTPVPDQAPVPDPAPDPRGD
jgi:hypothetical protein